jgi:hypothetical protein
LFSTTHSRQAASQPRQQDGAAADKHGPADAPCASLGGQLQRRNFHVGLDAQGLNRNLT